MSEPDNIVEFHRMTLMILGKLYSVHPEDIEFDASSIFENEVPLHEEVNLFENTANYLLENGYLTKTQIGFRLNAKAFAVLQKPDPLQPSKSLGSSVAAWMADTASTTGKDATVALGPNALKTMGAALGLPT
ncbi:hypothetical protein CN203_10980 [Sinorhizobium meliloti]|uniref:hypothetical protein n=1 Tax=Rhizobium meliloti TaxID=382 RepID=UPI000FD9AAB7|nr:hypothetical protein [Sinorhizobium meliloti]RVH78241.1 hypothetical protein CN203_10980 [Sinorhizobium meliloti]